MPTAGYLKPAAAAAALARENAIDGLRNTADIPEPVAQMIRDNIPVTKYEQKLAVQERTRLFADTEFVKAYLLGNRAACSRLAIVNIILSRPVLP